MADKSLNADEGRYRETDTYRPTEKAERERKRYERERERESKRGRKG